MQHTVEHLRFPKATIEAITKFCQITGEMLGADAMIDTTNIALDIGNQSMHPGQDLRGILARAGDQPFVTAGELSRKPLVAPLKLRNLSPISPAVLKSLLDEDTKIH
jgi:hypothetical protein